MRFIIFKVTYGFPTYRTANRVDLLFDARHLNASGIGSYTKRILDVLPEWSQQRDRSVCVLTDSDLPDTGLKTITFAQSRMYSVREQISFLRATLHERARLLWTPHYVPPLLSSVPYCVTVHDLIHLAPSAEGGLPQPKRTIASGLIWKSLRGAELIFTDTEAVRSVVRAQLGVAPRRVITAPVGIDPAWFRSSPTSNSVAPPYFVYVGNVKRHKNLSRLLQAFSIVSRYRPDVELLLVGGGRSLRTVDNGVRHDLGTLNGKVRTVGRLEQSELIRIVSEATALVLPSLHEGMGIPPLEAMAAGTASLVSDIPALRETCGAGSLYCDPSSAEDIADKMLMLLLDDQQRHRVIDRGRAWVRGRQEMASANRALLAIEDWFQSTMGSQV